MKEPVEILVNGNKSLKIYTDEGLNPRTEFDNIGTMYCFHGRYNMGDKHDLSINEANKLEHNRNYITLPIYMYDHSGQTIATTPFSCPWDSRKLGFITISKENARKQFNWKVITKKRIQEVKKMLQHEVEIYDNYITGDVYRYELYEDDEHIRSSGRFYGSDHKKNGLFECANWEN